MAKNLHLCEPCWILSSTKRLRLEVTDSLARLTAGACPPFEWHRQRFSSSPFSESPAPSNEPWPPCSQCECLCVRCWPGKTSSVNDLIISKPAVVYVVRHRQTMRSAKTYRRPNTCTQMPYRLLTFVWEPQCITNRCSTPGKPAALFFFPLLPQCVGLRAEPTRANCGPPISQRGGGTGAQRIAMFTCFLGSLGVCEVLSAWNSCSQCSFSNHP